MSDGAPARRGDVRASPACTSSSARSSASPARAWAAATTGRSATAAGSRRSTGPTSSSRSRTATSRRCSSSRSIATFVAAWRRRGEPGVGGRGGVLRMAGARRGARVRGRAPRRGHGVARQPAVRDGRRTGRWRWVSSPRGRDAHPRRRPGRRCSARLGGVTRQDGARRARRARRGAAHRGDGRAHGQVSGRRGRVPGLPAVRRNADVLPAAVHVQLTHRVLAFLLVLHLVGARDRRLPSAARRPSRGARVPIAARARRAAARRRRGDGARQACRPCSARCTRPPACASGSRRSRWRTSRGSRAAGRPSRRRRESSRVTAPSAADARRARARHPRGAARPGPSADERARGDRAGAAQSFARDLVALTKPRIISLLLVTTIAPMYVAGEPELAARARGVRRRLPDGRRRERGEHVHRPRHRRPDGAHAAAPDPERPHARRGGARVRRAAAPRRRRSCSRTSPTCSPRRSRSAGFYFYVFVYTRWLKRTSPQNIVIGGAAGAFPPLVGWAAVTGRVDLLRRLPLPHHLLLDAAALLGARAPQADATTAAPACRWRRSCGASARRCARCSGTR